MRRLAAPFSRLQDRGGDRHLEGCQTLAALAQLFGAPPNLITQWKTELLEGASNVFANATEKRRGEPDLKLRHAKIGQLTLENDLFSDALG